MSVSSSVPFSFLGRLHLEDRVTKLVCHRSAPEEKPEATIGKWGRLEFLSWGGLSSRTVSLCLYVGHSVCPTSVCLGFLFSDSPPIRPWTHVTPVSVVLVSETTSQSIYYFINLSYYTVFIILYYQLPTLQSISLFHSSLLLYLTIYYLDKNNNNDNEHTIMRFSEHNSKNVFFLPLYIMLLTRRGGAQWSKFVFLL